MRNLRTNPSKSPKGVENSEMARKERRVNLNRSRNRSSRNCSGKKSKSPSRSTSPTTKTPKTVPELEPYQPKDLQHYAGESGFKLIDPTDYPQYAKYFEEPKGERFGKYGDKFVYRNIHILPSRKERFFAPDNTFEDPRILEKLLADPTPEEVENKAELEKGVLERNTEAAKYNSFRSYVRTRIGPIVQADSGDSEYENDDASGSQQSDPEHQPLRRSESHTFNVAVDTLVNKVHGMKAANMGPCDCRTETGAPNTGKGKTEMPPPPWWPTTCPHLDNFANKYDAGGERSKGQRFYATLKNSKELDVDAFLAEPKVANWKEVNWKGPSETVKRDVPAEQSLVPDLAPGKKPRTPLPSGRPLVCLTDHRPKPPPQPKPKRKSKPKPKNKKKKGTPQPSLSQQSTENGVNVQQIQATLGATSSTGTTRQRSIEPTYMDKDGVRVLSMRFDSPKREASQKNGDLPEEQETMQSTPTTGLSIPPSPAGQKRKSADQPSSGVGKKLKTMPSSQSSVSQETLTMAGNQSATTAQAALVDLSGQPLIPAISTPSDCEHWRHGDRGPIFGNTPEVAPPRPEFLNIYKPGNLAYFGLEKNQYLDDKTLTPPVIEFTAYEWIPALPRKNQTVRSALTGPKGGGSFIGKDGMWSLRNLGEEVVKKPGGANKGGSNCPQSSSFPEIQTGEPDHSEDPEYFEDSKML